MDADLPCFQCSHTHLSKKVNSTALRTVPSRTKTLQVRETFRSFKGLKMFSTLVQTLSPMTAPEVSNCTQDNAYQKLLKVHIKFVNLMNHISVHDLSAQDVKSQILPFSPPLCSLSTQRMNQNENLPILRKKDGKDEKDPSKVKKDTSIAADGSLPIARALPHACANFCKPAFQNILDFLMCFNLHVFAAYGKSSYICCSLFQQKRKWQFVQTLLEDELILAYVAAQFSCLHFHFLSLSLWNVRSLCTCLMAYFIISIENSFDGFFWCTDVVGALFGTDFMKWLPRISCPLSVYGVANLCCKLIDCASESNTSVVRSHYFSKSGNVWVTPNIWQSLSSNVKLSSTANAGSILTFNLQIGLKDISCDNNFCASNVISVSSYFSQDCMLSMTAFAYANSGNLSADVTPTITSTSRLFLAQIWVLTLYYSYVCEIFMKVHKSSVNHESSLFSTKVNNG